MLVQTAPVIRQMGGRWQDRLAFLCLRFASMQMVFFLCFNDGARRLWGFVLARAAADDLLRSHQATENLCLALFFACVVINVARAAFYTLVLARKEWPEESAVRTARARQARHARSRPLA